MYGNFRELVYLCCKVKYSGRKYISTVPYVGKVREPPLWPKLELKDRNWEMLAADRFLMKSKGVQDNVHPEYFFLSILCIIFIVIHYLYTYKNIKTNMSLKLIKLHWSSREIASLPLWYIWMLLSSLRSCCVSLYPVLQTFFLLFTLK